MRELENSDTITLGELLAEMDRQFGDSADYCTLMGELQCLLQWEKETVSQWVTRVNEKVSVMRKKFPRCMTVTDEWLWRREIAYR